MTASGFLALKVTAYRSPAFSSGLEAITSELLDITSSFEALQGKRRR
jgi:hypothetical protein